MTAMLDTLGQETGGSLTHTAETDFTQALALETTGEAGVMVANSQGNHSHEEKSAVLHRHLGQSFPRLIKAKGCYLYLDDGRKILDASGGASVACLGHGNERVNKAMLAQMSAVAYCPTIFYTSPVQEELCQILVRSTKGHMSRAYIVSSGSEAMEAALKLTRQIFLEREPPEPQRTRFIARRQSYHGITLGALSVGGHAARRANFEPMLFNKVSQVSPCNVFRGKKLEETNEQYVARLAQELDEEFQKQRPETVCAFVAEPVVGAVRLKSRERCCLCR
jgi:adenosylmethionine-8-amino-7-oxononanoate aminotransferase